jgi:hypothetical protein
MAVKDAVMVQFDQLVADAGPLVAHSVYNLIQACLLEAAVSAQETETAPSCFYCGWDLKKHRNNEQGHAWRRGPAVTEEDLAANDQMTAALNR